MEFDFNKINKFLNDEEIKINKTIRSSKNNNVDSQINTTITPLNTKVDFNKIKQEQNSILSTPYQPTTKIVKQSEKSIETDYQKLFDNSSNKFNNAVLEEANKNTIQLANSGSKGIDIGNIFKTPENFKDGYQFGDVTKTTLSTIGDVAASGVEGILRFGEGLGDLAQYGVAGVADLFGADNFANSVRKNAQQDAISQLYDMTGIDKLNDNSVAGSTTNAIAQGVGNVVAMSNAGALLPKGMQTIGTKNFKLPTASIVSGMGSGMTEAYNNGATDGEAFVYGLGSGLVEGFSESLFSGLGSKFSKIYGGGALDDVAIKSLTNKIGNKTLKILSESGLKALGEGTEEVISGYGNAIIKKLTYLSDEDFKKIVEDENLLEQFIIGTLTSAVMQSPSTITSVKNGTDYIPDEISQNSSKTTANSNKNTQNGINTLINDNNVENSAKYSYLPTNNEKSNNLRQSASNYFNNSQETINMINTIDKVVQDKGYNVLFDNTIVNSRGESVNAQIKALDNGEIEIKINPNSERAGEFLLCHEITHAIETNSMKELVMDYASKHSDFNESLESLKQSYGTNEVTDEVLADISGQLFGNQEFINNLSMQQPNVFKRIYNKIVELANKITGNSKESLFIKDLKNKWETAYRNTSLEESINNLNDSTKYSTIGLKGAKNLSKNSDSRYYKNMLKNYHNAVDIFNSSNENLETTNIKSKQETGWFQTKYGDWSALISDENSKMLQKLEPNKTYKLGDILEHELLYEAYPELQKLKIKTADIETTGGYASFQFLPANTITDEIYIRNSDLNKKDFRKTLLHEINHYIQHKENYDKRSRGTNSKIAGVEDYRNNLGEIISNETKINADLTQEELDAIILPEQAKENPQYKNIREKLLESNRNDLLKNGDDNNALQNLELPIQNKIQNNKVVNKKDNNSGRIINDNEEFYEENSNENIEQTNEITDKSHQEDTNGIEELENSSFSYDNQGRTLTKEQQDYFKDSKVRDENGNLLTMYHGTNNDFTIFNNDFIGKNTNNEGIFGKGFYFTEKKSYAEYYNRKNGKVATDGSGTTMEVYLDIKKPFYWNEIDTPDKMQSFIEKTGMPKYVLKWNNTLKNQMSPLTEIRQQRKFREILEKNGYDGVIYNYDNSSGEYVIFNPEQVKNINNTNPTSDADIRYSQQNDKWQEYVEKNYKSSGTRTDMKKHLYPLERAQTENKPVEKLPKAKREIPQDPTKESTYNPEIVDKKKRIKEKIKKNIEKQSYKAVNIATKTGQTYLDFDTKQKRQFKEQLRKYIGKTQKQLTNARTWNDIKNIVSQYADKEITYVDEELKSVKNTIRNSNIKITDNLKQQITDYSDFRKDNFGKLKLGTSGMNVDSFYQELSEQYPYYFGSATTEVDMLYELSDFMNQDTNIVEKFKLDDNTLDRATTKVYNSLMQNSMSEESINELQKELETKMNKRTREVIQEELLKDMGINLSDISNGNDISSIDLSRTDPIRVNEKVFGAKIGQKINEATINKTKHNEAERTRWLNKEREEIKALGIKSQSKESEAVQKYGEKQYITRNNEVIPYGDAELARDFPDIETQNKIKKAAKFIRNKYDNYIEQINEVLVDMGYTPIKKRPDYMRHFEALNDVFSKYGIPLNAESMKNDSLPTDINGLTDQFKPGKQYFANAMQRMGLKTEYDAITGIDGYLEGASNLIFHTEDIQRYRTLSNLIRDTYGSKNGYEDFETMTVQEQEQRIEDIRSNKLAKYSAWLDEQANALAGKKGKIDRGAEELFGRKVYTVLQTAKKQVGSNMTGYNVRSALTNFASSVQGASKTNKMAFLKGTISTINNIIHKDGLVYKSDFLTNRFGSDLLAPKLWQKMSNAGQNFMKGSDYFTANQVWRSKYFENLSNGMSESEAIRKADDFASRVMGDRSKGSTATIFNSNTLGFLTQFQLEVNNQWSSLIHDNKMDIQRGNNTGASVVFQLGQLFAMSYMFNGMMKSLTGSSVMLDPIDLLKKIFNPDEDEEKTLDERAREALGEVVDNIPFASIFTDGGRIPITEAFDGATTGIKWFTGQTDEYGNKYTLSDVGSDVIESVFYWLLPTGYNQAKKTIKGASMYSGKLPTAGSYTDSGNLRFTADKTPTGIAKALTFGQYSSKEAQDYIDSGFKTISKNHIQEMKDLGMNSTEYRKYRNGLSKAGTTNSEKLNYINNLDVSIEQKNIMANNVVDSDKYTVDMSNYSNYGSYETMKYALQNPTNYSIITSITNYDDYLSYKDEVNKIKEEYSGTENSTIRKQKVFQYVNSLPYSKAQKIILFNMLGNYGISDYKNDVHSYINGLDISKSEKEQMWQQIYGK